MGNVSINVNGAINKITKLSIIDDRGEVASLSNKEKRVINKYVADLIFERSKYYVPVKTGHLKSTGKVVESNFGEFSVVYEAPYAKYVHEIMMNRHERPSKAKFLEDAGYDVQNLLSYMGLKFNFKFSMEIGDTVALHIEPIGKRQYKLNMGYIKSLIAKIYNYIS